MGRHIRDYRRVTMNPKTARVILSLAEKTEKDHASKCLDRRCVPCPHNATLVIARLLRQRLKIGRKRAYLDLPDPYNTDDHEEARRVLHFLAGRIEGHVEVRSDVKRQTTKALLRVVEEVRSYADRSPLEVIAEAALWRTK